ncbi:MAG: flagellar export chaperone FliS [Syntrophomonadaceae bacterium]|nr:flagellar export chaperone FliS [Syntrophomonadaceae bacterium]
MSVNAQEYASYKNAAIETTSPGKLLLLLYDAAICNLEEAVINIGDKDIAAAHHRLIKGQDIVLEFICTLNMDYEISHKLKDLYDYMYRRLVEANVKKDVEIIEEVRGLLGELRDTWRDAVNKTNVRVPASVKRGGLNVQG